MDHQYELLKAVGEIKVDIAEIRKDLNHHIVRTNLNEERIEILENYHLKCPARSNLIAKKSMVALAKDWGTILGLVVVLAKMFGLISLSF
jgi:hypothetical protein